MHVPRLDKLKKKKKKKKTDRLTESDAKDRASLGPQGISTSLPIPGDVGKPFRETSLPHVCLHYQGPPINQVCPGGLFGDVEIKHQLRKGDQVSPYIPLKGISR